MSNPGAGRLPQFEKSRFVGVRDTMTVYDCDDPDQFALIQTRQEEDDLVGRKLIQTYGPDSLAEARNRGFRPVGAGRFLRRR